MQFSLRTYLWVLALAGVEFTALYKVPSLTVMVAFDVGIMGFLLIATWGSFFSSGTTIDFYRGFAIVGWAIILMSAFDRQDFYVAHPEFKSSPLAKCALAWFGHHGPSAHASDESDLGYSLVRVGMFFRTWHLFSILNCGLIAGCIAEARGFQILQNKTAKISEEGIIS